VSLPSLTVPQVARIVGAHPSTVRAEIKRGELKAWKLGAHYRIQPSDLADWMESNRVASDDAPPSSIGRLERIEQEGRRNRDR
jgi:excisionase family DNA binding protein